MRRSTSVPLTHPRQVIASYMQFEHEILVNHINSPLLFKFGFENIRDKCM